MTAFIAIFLFLSKVTSAFPCDGVQYLLGNISVFYPAGVCKTDSDGGSEMALCQNANDINIAFYSSNDCSGPTTNSQSFVAGISVAGVTDYSISCCTGTQCNYMLETEYETSSCNQDPNTAPFDQNVWTIGACVGIQYMAMYTYTSCQGSTASYDFYFAKTTTCSGSDPYVLSKSTGDCDDSGSNPDFHQTKVVCGRALDTCNDNTNDPTISPVRSPTSDTPSPTYDTVAPTPIPTDNTIPPTTGAPTTETDSPTPGPTSDTHMPTEDTISPTSNPTATPRRDPGIASVFNMLFNCGIVIVVAAMVV